MWIVTAGYIILSSAVSENEQHTRIVDHSLAETDHRKQSTINYIAQSGGPWFSFLELDSTGYWYGGKYYKSSSSYSLKSSGLEAVLFPSFFQQLIRFDQIMVVPVM